MSDRNLASDPIDKAYAEAEAVLGDEAARAARRARILGAVASEAPAPLPRPIRRSPSFGRGGWLVAASVAGVGLLLSLQLGQEFKVRPEARPGKSAPPAARPSAMPSTPQVTTAPPPAAVAPARPAPPTRPAAAQAPGKPADVAPPAPPPVVASAPRSDAGDAPFVEGVIAAPPARARESAAPAIVQRRVVPEASAGRDEKTTRASLPDPAARLRQAAAAGRLAEMTALLSSGAPVDGADDEGETALMKTVQANHPAAAALLRRHGASLDRENRAGRSARDMASSVGDADLNRALGLAPGS